jgi:hypothetical protein
VGRRIINEIPDELIGWRTLDVRVPFADVGPIKIPDGFATSRCSSSPTSFR